MYIYNGKVSHIYFYDVKVSRIDGASVTIILCLHVLITRRKFTMKKILFNLCTHVMTLNRTYKHTSEIIKSLLPEVKLSKLVIQFKVNINIF